MQVKITASTKYNDVALFADQMAANETVKAEAWSHIFGHDFWSLTIDEFCDLSAGESERLARRAIYEGELTVYGYALLVDFKAKAVALGEAVERLSPPQNAAERAAAQAVKMTLFESMAFFARDFFGLKSFAEASRVTLGEWLMARKAKYTAVMLERALIREQTKNLKR